MAKMTKAEIVELLHPKTNDLHKRQLMRKTLAELMFDLDEATDPRSLAERRDAGVKRPVRKQTRLVGVMRYRRP
jgi:hypothetical protein